MTEQNLGYLNELLNYWIDCVKGWRERELYVIGAEWAQCGCDPEEAYPWLS